LRITFVRVRRRKKRGGPTISRMYYSCANPLLASSKVNGAGGCTMENAFTLRIRPGIGRQPTSSLEYCGPVPPSGPLQGGGGRYPSKDKHEPQMQMGPKCYRKRSEIGPPAGFRPAGGPISFPGSSPAKIRPGMPFFVFRPTISGGPRGPLFRPILGVPEVRACLKNILFSL
jgi:hypothetical protein